ncbi:MAG: hypothetical protein QXE57_02990 [Nitrososphaerales archaeon]
MIQPFAAQEIGSLKKPEWLLKILRDKRASPEAKKAARDDLAYLNIRLLEDCGLDYVYDGEARRAEMYEYVVKNVGGFELAGWVRSWDNKYYKKARVVDKLSYRGPYHLEEFKFVAEHAKKMVKIPITGPYTLADWSYNEYYQSKEDLLFDLARSIINPLLKDLASAGAKVIQIDEPAATTHPSETRMFVEAFNEAVSGVNAKITVHICYSGNNYRALFPDALDMKCSQFTLEFANRDTNKLGLDEESRIGYSALNLFKEYRDKREVGVGVVDVHIDDIEPPELIRDRILYAAKVLEDPNRVYVNPDCGLRTRSRSIAFAKLRNLCKGRDLARTITST